MALQEFTRAGQAASESSARQPGSFDQLTASKRTVGAGVTAPLRGVAQAASSASTPQMRIRLTLVIVAEARPRCQETRNVPIYSLMPA
jgi:hypothetical protein